MPKARTLTLKTIVIFPMKKDNPVYLGRIKHIFIDTNIWLRYFLRDSEEHFLEVVNCFKFLEQENIAVFTSNIVVFEIIHVCQSVYHIPKTEIAAMLDDILTYPNISLIESADTEKAIILYVKTGIKYANCLISTQIPLHCPILTYDKEFSRIPDIDTIHPSLISATF